MHLPEALTRDWPPRLSAADERGWFRFQRLYDIARSVLRTPADVHRLLRETAEDERAEGSGWLEIQIDPSGYGQRFGGLTPTVELVLDAAAAGGHRDRGGHRPGHRGQPDQAPAGGADAGPAGRPVRGPRGGRLRAEQRRAPRRRGRASQPRSASRPGPACCSPRTAGNCAGPASVRACLDDLHADRIGHGVTAAADAELTKRLAAGKITLEVCPASNVALGVAPDAAAVPLDALLGDGVPVALGADDPLLFGSRLTAQYEIARRVHGLADDQLAELARMSVRGSARPATARRLLAGIDAWLAGPASSPARLAHRPG